MMIDAPQAAADHALARAVVYRALSLGLQRPTADRLRQLGAHDRFAAAAAALGEIAARATEGADLVGAATRLTAFAVPPLEALEATYVRLFGHTTRGLVCACETEYGDDNVFHQPQQLADIAGYYLAFGVQPATAAGVRPDHVACECEFMDFMNRKEALFLDSRPDDETLEVTREAARTFLRDHLGRFGRAFAARLTVEDADGLYGILGAALFALVDEDCRRMGIPSGPVDLPVRPDVADDTPMACGSSGTPELIQIQRRP